MSADTTNRRGTDALARKRLLGILSGSWLAQGVYALVKLGIPDLLAIGPRTAADLAAATGADANALSRLLRALALLGLFSQPTPDTYGLTATTELLRSDVDGSVQQHALMQGEEIYQSFGEIMHTLHTGRPAFEKVYGQPFYDYIGENPEQAYIFNESMGSQPAPAAVTACRLRGDETIVDVGGGNGALLADLLHAHPRAHGVLVDLTEAAQAARDRFVHEGLADRAEAVDGSFFTEVPAGGDVYLLSRVLHNWTDHNALEILRVVHAAMRPGARLLVLEDVLPDNAAPGSRSAAGMVDLLMLVTLEGCDRTAAEYRELLRQAGFERPDAESSTAPGLIEAVRP
jgi:ubiquinone/menaquinone biosynthesis C-methylase UbiE